MFIIMIVIIKLIGIFVFAWFFPSLNFKRLNDLSDVEFVGGITKINFASSMTTVRWLLTLRFFKTSAVVRTEMMSNSLQYSESVSSFT